MFDTTESQDPAHQPGLGTAFATLVIGQLHALARHRTEDGKSDLDLAATSFWAEPAGRALDPLLSWAGPDTVYLAYGKWWIFALGVVAVVGYMVMRLRAPYGVELWGWRIMLVGYALLALGAGAFYWGQWTSYNALRGHRAPHGHPRRPAVDRRAAPSSASRCCAGAPGRSWPRGSCSWRSRSCS